MNVIYTILQVDNNMSKCKCDKVLECAIKCLSRNKVLTGLETDSHKNSSLAQLTVTRNYRVNLWIMGSLCCCLAHCLLYLQPIQVSMLDRKKHYAVCPKYSQKIPAVLSIALMFLSSQMFHEYITNVYIIDSTNVYIKD